LKNYKTVEGAAENGPSEAMATKATGNILVGGGGLNNKNRFR